MHPQLALALTAALTLVACTTPSRGGGGANNDGANNDDTASNNDVATNNGVANNDDTAGNNDAPPTLGRICDTEADCDAGQFCDEVLIGDACEPAGMACTATCEADADCEAFGNARCFETCAGVMECGVVATDDLPLGGVCDTSEQCLEGLTCMELRTGDACEPFASACTTTCADDADCTGFDERGRCLTRCDGQMACALVE